jgi:succinyl-diaminopimelate desuccinylase
MNSSDTAEAAVLTDASHLVALNTSTPDGVRLAMEYANGVLGEAGIAGEIQGFNGRPVLTAEVGPATGPLLIWLCHADVGKPSDLAQCRTHRRAARLIGHGIYAAHAPTACMLHALPHVRELDQARVRLVMVGDHEQPPPHTIGDYARSLPRPPDFCIAGGPTNLAVGYAAVGLIKVRGTIRSKGDHPISPERNPRLETIRLFQAIKTMPTRGALRVKSLRDLVVDLTHRSGGQTPGDICEFEVTVRFAPGITAEEVRQAIDAIVRQQGAQLRRRADPLELEVDIAAPIPPWQIEPNHPCVEALASAVRGGHGGGDAFTVSQDASELTLAGWPGVEFGLRGGVNRVSGQWLDLDSVVPYTRALIDFPQRLPTN